MGLQMGDKIEKKVRYLLLHNLSVTFHNNLIGIAIVIVIGVAERMAQSAWCIEHREKRIMLGVIAG